MEQLLFLDFTLIVNAPVKVWLPSIVEVLLQLKFNPVLAVMEMLLLEFWANITVTGNKKQKNDRINLINST